MRRSLFMLLLAACLAASLLVAGAQATTTRPALRVVTPKPLKIAGVHFRAGERVRVTGVIAGTLVRRTVTATAAGTFTLSFGPNVSWDGCRGETFVFAVGNKGSRAVLKFPPRLIVCIELDLP